MLAFHSDSKIKAKYLKRVRAHFKSDEIVQGMTGKDGKGCAVWCTLDKYEHSAYETELGIPRILARLEDGIFEGLSVEESKGWPEKFLKAIKPGADLSKIGSKFLVWLLEDVIQFAKPQGKIAIQQVIDLYKRQLGGENITYNQWIESRSAADAAVYAAYDAVYAAYDADADAAADAAAAYAAYAAAAAAAYAADAAAVYAADAAAYAKTPSAFSIKEYKEQIRSKQAAKLLELLKECKC